MLKSEAPHLVCMAVENGETTISMESFGFFFHLWDRARLTQDSIDEFLYELIDKGRGLLQKRTHRDRSFLKHESRRNDIERFLHQK